MENGGILYVFPVFHSAWMAKKIRYPAADDLFRVSQAKTRRRAAAVNFARQLSTHRYFPDPPGIGGAAKGSLAKGSWHGEAVTEGFTMGAFAKAPTYVETCYPGESPRLGVAEARQIVNQVQHFFPRKLQKAFSSRDISSDGDSEAPQQRQCRLP